MLKLSFTSNKLFGITGNKPTLDSHSFTESDLPRIAREILACLQAGEWILLEGPLGVGKSALARVLLREMGARLDQAGSPTFPLMREYPLPGGGLACHVDLYRLEKEEELQEIGLEALSLEPDVRVILEWPDRFPEWSKRLPRALRVKLRFDPGGDPSVRVGEWSRKA